jgi:hypothetical protein
VIDANQAAGGGYPAAAQVRQSIVVNPALLTITASSVGVNQSQPVPTITPIFSTFFNGDTSAVLTSQPTCVTTYTTSSPVGSSSPTSCSGAAAANYTIIYVNGSVTVGPAQFLVSGSISSLTITRGATTGNTVTLTVTPSYNVLIGYGFHGEVFLTCSITPVAARDPATCSFSPDGFFLDATGPQTGALTSTLTITTTAATTSQNQLKKLLWPSAGTALALLLMIGVPRRRGHWLAMLGVLALSIAIGVIGCGGSGSGGSGGGGGGGGNSGTTPGAYTVTVTATSNSSSTIATDTIALTVQ